jgi:cation diffusion facilitator family transporter
MISVLVKIFIKDADNVKDAGVRGAYGVLAGGVGIFCNVCLFIFKFIAGLLTGAVSVCADAFNNLSDAGSSVITLVGFKMACKPADTDHPYGHGRIEYMAGLGVAVAIVVMGFELLRTSVTRIINPEDTVFSVLSVVILFVSILVKMWMALFNYRLGKKIESAAMKATATDSISDCVTTLVVLISVFVQHFTGFHVDGYAGALVALLVMYAGYQAAKDTIAPLLGKAPDEELVAAIEKTVTEDDGILGIHDMIIHDYGPGRVFASLHAEVPYNMDVLDAHDIIDRAECRVKERLGIDISIHMDPVMNDDERLKEIRGEISAIVAEIDGRITMHDFRLVDGPGIKKVIFDCVVPYDLPISDSEVRRHIADSVTKLEGNYEAVINIDKPFVVAKH